MTPYKDRLNAGYYLEQAQPTTAEPSQDDEALDTRTLAELRETAEALGLPTYGTKADLTARIEAAS